MEDNKSKVKYFIDFIKTVLNGIITIGLIVGPSSYFGYLGKTVEMGFAIVAGALASAFINLDKIKLVKGAGFEARIKKADKAAKVATATLEKMQELTGPLIYSMLKLVVYHDRIEGIGHTQEIKIIEGLRKVAKIIKLDATMGFNEVEEEFFKTRLSDLYNAFVSSALRDIVGSEIGKKLQSLKNFEANEFPSKKQIQDVIDVYDNKISNETCEKLENYLYFKKNREFRNTKK